MLDLYHPAASPLHRAPPEAKLLALMGSGTTLFFLDHWAQLLPPMVAVGALYALARIPPRLAFAQIRPALWILILLLAAQIFISDFPTAVFVVLRLALLLWLASLVTLTTRSSDMIDAVTSALSPLQRLGVNTGKVGLAFSLALRFVPVLARITLEVREAQGARGHGRSVLATAMPVAVRTIEWRMMSQKPSTRVDTTARHATHLQSSGAKLSQKLLELRPFDIISVSLLHSSKVFWTSPVPIASQMAPINLDRDKR